MKADFQSLSTFGEHFIVEPQGTSLLPGERQALEELRPPAVMFRARNFSIDAAYSTWLKDFRKLTDQIRTAVDRENMLICIDHEGGRVVRPPEPITRFPYMAKWGERGTRSLLP